MSGVIVALIIGYCVFRQTCGAAQFLGMPLLSDDCSSVLTLGVCDYLQVLSMNI